MTAVTALLQVCLFVHVGEPAAAQEQGPDSLPGARIAILVDESGSLSDDAVAQERLAASSVAVVDPSPSSEVAIIGFGSSNGEGQSATQTYCSLSPTRAPEDRIRLQTCAEKIHKRSPAEGNDTDFVGAIQAAVNEVKGGGEDRPRIVFLLTDGVLDVRNSPQFGPDPQNRTAEALRQLNEHTLSAARGERVQVWPLGFGDANLEAMTAIANGGFGANPACVTGGAPRAASASVDTVAKLALQAFAAARCGRVDAPDPLELSDVSEIRLSIPAIATDASIVVSKPNSDVLVAYLDPDKQIVPTEGSRDGSTFSGSGTGRSIESLRITNPKSGVWTVRLTAPPGVAGGLANATAFFTGAVYASLQVSPPAPSAGAQVTVQVRVLTRRGAVLDASSLGGLNANLRVAGQGFEPLTVEAHDDGRAPEVKASDGMVGATFQLAPTARAGPVRIVGGVDAPGMTSDARPYNFLVPETLGSQTVAQIDLPPRRSVHPGTTLHARVSVSNPGPSPVQVALSVEDLSDGGLVAVEPATVTAAPGPRTSVTVDVFVADESSRGPLAFKLVAREGEQPLASTAFVSQIVAPPPPLWPWLLALLLTSAAGAAIYVRRKHRPQTVAFLHAKLLDEDGHLLGATVPGKPKATALEVRVVHENGQLPHLEPARGDPDSITISWTRGRELRYTSPRGRAQVPPGARVYQDEWPSWTLTAETKNGEPSPTSRAPVPLTRDGPKADAPATSSASRKATEAAASLEPEPPRQPPEDDPFKTLDI